nr:phosphoribosylanthranilate isomerase [Blautia sp. MSJ-19]
MWEMTAGNYIRTKIKICGLRRRDDILAVNEAKPDYCGFIVEFPRSFRSVTADQVRELVKELAPEIQPVGVFVNAPMELVRALLEDGTLALAQLHGQEDESYIRELKTYTDKPIIKAFSIKTAEDIEKALQSPADYILLDQGGGGTGKTFDWSLIPEIRRPFFLAGGIGAANLEQAIREIHPYAVDLSSSVETEKWKDPAKIRKVADIVRSAGQD